MSFHEAMTTTISAAPSALETHEYESGDRSTKVDRLEGETKRRQERQRSIASVHRGTENAHARHLDDERRGYVPDDDSPKRSRNVVKRSLPQSNPETPKRLGDPHDESRGASWERASTGARKSFEWQTSVERIACLFRGEVERPRNGSKDASQKEAPQHG